MIRAILNVAVGCLLLGGCVTDAVTLPADFNEQKVKVIEVSYQEPLGEVNPLPGLQGGPVPTVVGDAQLIEQFLKAGVDVTRVPQGYVCDYALAGVFPDPNANADSAASYDFTAIDNVMQGVSALGGEIVWQATFDIGADTCNDETQAEATGQRPANPALWAKVVTNTLRHFDSDLMETVPAAVWDDPSPRTWDVRYVEFIDDPLGRGGYPDVQAVAEDFVLMAQAIKTAFPNLPPDQTPRVNVVGPAITVGLDSAGEPDLTDVVAFLDALETANATGLLDVLSFQTAVQFPGQNRAIGLALRAELASRDWSDGVELWATRYSVDASYLLPPKNDLEVGPWSIFSGAFATATKILWQDVVDSAIWYRGDRRHKTDNANTVSNLELTPMWDQKGLWRPAGIAWQPWRLLTGEGKTRVTVSDPRDTDLPGLAVIAVREDAVCGDAPLEQCPNLLVLVANTNTQNGQTQLDYQLVVDGIGAPGEGTRQVRVNWSIINESTREFTFADSTLVTVVDQRLFYQFSSSVPAVDFLKIELNPR